MKQGLVQAGVLGPEECEAMEQEHFAQMEQIMVAAARGADPDPATLEEGLFSTTSTVVVPAEYRTERYRSELIRDYRDNDGQMPYRRALQEALIEEMIRDRRVVLYGEDVAEHGGAFAATAGLFEIFGRCRVFNAPISEATLCGAAVGMAMTGMRPVCELMYIDFILMAMDQLGNQAAKTKYMFGGKAVIPMVCRTSVGGGKGYAGQHSQSLEAIPAAIPGLKVVAASTPEDAKGLLKAAIRDDKPVIFIEHQLLYGEKGPVPKGEDFVIPLGKAAVRQEGSDVTLLAWSYMAKVAQQAAELLAAKGVSAEVIDVRSLVPLDTETIVASVKKTNKVAVICQAPGKGSFGEHITRVIQQEAFEWLDAPVELIAAAEVPPPMAPTLEKAFMPQPETVCERVLKQLGGA